MATIAKTESELIEKVVAVGEVLKGLSPDEKSAVLNCLIVLAAARRGKP